MSRSDVEILTEMRRKAVEDADFDESKGRHGWAKERREEIAVIDRALASVQKAQQYLDYAWLLQKKIAQLGYASMAEEYANSLRALEQTAPSSSRTETPTP